MAYNHVAITGIVTKEPEFKTTPSGMNFCKFVLNVDAGFIGKDSEKIDKTDYFSVTLWSKTCEEARARLELNALILVSGSLKYESWKDKEGKKQSMVVINGNNVMYFDKINSGTKSNTEKILEKFPGKLKDAVDLPDELPF